MRTMFNINCPIIPLSGNIGVHPNSTSCTPLSHRSQSSWRSLNRISGKTLNLQSCWGLIHWCLFIAFKGKKREKKKTLKKTTDLFITFYDHFQLFLSLRFNQPLLCDQWLSVNISSHSKSKKATSVTLVMQQCILGQKRLEGWEGLGRGTGMCLRTRNYILTWASVRDPRHRTLLEFVFSSVKSASTQRLEQKHLSSTLE